MQMQYIANDYMQQESSTTSRNHRSINKAHPELIQALKHLNTPSIFNKHCFLHPPLKSNIRFQIIIIIFLRENNHNEACL